MCLLSKHHITEELEAVSQRLNVTTRHAAALLGPTDLMFESEQYRTGTILSLN